MPIPKPIAGMAGVAGASIAIASIWVAIGMSPWFDWTMYSLSDLGKCGPEPVASSQVFNTGLIAAGVLAGIFAVGLFERMLNSIGRKGALVLAIATVFLILVGVFCLPNPIHNVVTTAFFVLLTIGLFLIGLGLMGQLRFSLGWFTLVTAATVAGAGVAILIALSTGSGIAIPEYIAVQAAAVWMSVIGYELIICRL